MKIKTSTWVAIGAGVVVAGGVLWWLHNLKIADAAAKATKAAADLAAGVVVGAGEAVGIPATDADQCAADLAAGRTWDASFSCPAGTFVKSLFGSAPPPPQKSALLHAIPPLILLRRHDVRY